MGYRLGRLRLTPSQASHRAAVCRGVNPSRRDEDSTVPAFASYTSREERERSAKCDEQPKAPRRSFMLSTACPQVHGRDLRRFRQDSLFNAGPPKVSLADQSPFQKQLTCRSLLKSASILIRSSNEECGLQGLCESSYAGPGPRVRGLRSLPLSSQSNASTRRRAQSPSASACTSARTLLAHFKLFQKATDAAETLAAMRIGNAIRE